MFTGINQHKKYSLNESKAIVQPVDSSSKVYVAGSLLQQIRSVIQKQLLYYYFRWTYRMNWKN